MADIDYIHTTEILKAASPFVDTGTRSTMELVTKLFDFIGSIKSYNQPSNMAACGFGDQTFNLEGLLSSVRPFCSEKERSFLDGFLNILNAKRMFETYSKYMDTMKSMQGFDFGQNNNFSGGNQDDSSTEESTPFDMDAFFQQFRTEESSETETDTDEEPTAAHFEFDYTGEDIDMDNDTEQSTTEQDHAVDLDDTIDLDNFINQLSNIQNKNATPTPPELKSDPKDKGSSLPPVEDNNKNASMMNMLKAMIPQEQKGTFENLSMLLNTMSYTDNNKKNEDNGE